MKICDEFARKNDLNVSFQSNIEGELVEEIQNSRNNKDGLIINGMIHSYIGFYTWCFKNENTTNCI